MSLGNVVSVALLFMCPLAVPAQLVFDTRPITIRSQQGSTAMLPCRIERIGTHKVVWTDEFKTLLTYNDRLIIDNSRYSLLRTTSNDWNLLIRNVRSTDAGLYECNVNTIPITVKRVRLIIEAVRHPPLCFKVSMPSSTSRQDYYSDNLKEFRRYPSGQRRYEHLATSAGNPAPVVIEKWWRAIIPPIILWK